MSLLESMFFGLWVVMTVAFVILEVHTQAFYAVFVAVGAAAAAITALAGGPLWLQGVLFAVLAIGGSTLIRPTLRARFDSAVPVARFRGIQGSADGLVGQPAITLDTVGDEHHPGHALFANDRWLAVTDRAEPLPADIPVVVVAVRGTTLLVRPQ
ncbi:MAG: NfeD family protein [Candidatus Dormibacteraeota bacterium]|uniref:NfeD family protein n=1 Tax=Candidatus Aeolococcus gillhamiae TaxID=3127015 RepID=A0A934MYX2_9BACT|nr:NfeD family protein [Candidatus Dormibacteraeota bacterium]